MTPLESAYLNYVRMADDIEFVDEGRPMNSQLKATAVLDERDGVCNDDDNAPSVVQFGNATGKWEENVKTEISDGRRHESAVTVEGINTQQKRDVLPLVERRLSFLSTNMNMVESSTAGKVNILSLTPRSIPRQFYLDQGSDLCPSSTSGVKSPVDKQEIKWINVSTHCERDANSFKQNRKHSPYERDFSWKDDPKFQPECKRCPLAGSGAAGRTSSESQGEKSTAHSGYSSNTDTSLSRGGSSGGFGGGGGDDGDKHIREKFKNWQLPSKRKIEPKADKKQKGEANKKQKMQRAVEEGVLDYRKKAPQDDSDDEMLRFDKIAESSEQRQMDVEAIAATGDDDARGAGCTPLATTSSCNDGNMCTSVGKRENAIKWPYSDCASQEMSSPTFPLQCRQAPRPKMEVQRSCLQITGPDNTRINFQLEKLDAGSALRITDQTFLNAMLSLSIHQVDEIDAHPAAEREETFPVTLTEQSDSVDLQAMYGGYKSAEKDERHLIIKDQECIVEHYHKMMNDLLHSTSRLSYVHNWETSEFDLEPNEVEHAVEEEEVAEQVEDEEEEEVVLPELTDDQLRRVQLALVPQPNGEVLVEGFRLQITRTDMNTLAGLNWLNDEIINFYMNMLMERGKNVSRPSVYATPTFFYPKVKSEGHKGVRRWTKRVDIFAQDYILIPVQLGMQWCLAVVDFRRKQLQYYDSMGGNNKACLDCVKDWMRAESLEKKQESFDWSAWTSVCMKDIPQQTNVSDCGMFACKFAEYISRDAPITFTQQDMPYFRKRMVFEILTKTLL